MATTVRAKTTHVSNKADHDFMYQALVCAKKGLGWTNPNPMVGCVIVKENRVIGTGYHQHYGQAHAEIVALNNCKASPKGATLYSTLAPCHHQGKTPPCSRSIVDAGIARVVIGAAEINNKAQGSIDYFKQAGIDVCCDILADECAAINPAFHVNCQRQRPFVIIKWAMSLMGDMILTGAKDRHISSKESQLDAHYWRQYCDAIIIGVNTLLHDNPQLTSRYNISNSSPKHPIRVVLDSKGRSAINARMLAKDSPGKTLVVTGKSVCMRWHQAIRENGHDVLVLPLDKNKQIPLPQLLQKLYQMGITSILVEGGAAVRKSFIEQNLVDHIDVYLAGVVMQQGKRATWYADRYNFINNDFKVSYNKENKLCLQD